MLARGAHVAGVASRGYAGVGKTVLHIARRHGIPCFEPSVVASASFASWLRAEGVDILLNVHSLVILPSEIVLAPVIGSFNLHPGPLPEYRGLNTPSWAIFEGQREYAVTLHWMDAGVDTGPTAFAEPIPVDEDDTGARLMLRCVRSGLPLIDRLLATAASDRDEIPKVSQPDLTVMMRGAGPPFPDGVPWDIDATTIARLIRASDFRPFASPWGLPMTRRRTLELGLVQAKDLSGACQAMPGTVADVTSNGVSVATSDGWLDLQKVSVGQRILDARLVLRVGDTLGGSGD